MTDSANGPIATNVLYEDDQIRIWNQHLAPGEKTAPHTHEHDYVLIDISGERVGVEPLSGTRGAFTERIELRVLSGQTYTVKKGSAEVAENIGESPYRAILVEFKQQDVQVPAV